VAAGFLNRIQKKRPYVLLKLALSADGKIGRRGEETQITGEEARARVHLMRARSDLVLVGRGTDDGDNPGLSVRLPGLEDRSPIRAVIGSRLREGVKNTLWIVPESVRTRADLDRISYRSKGEGQADLGGVMEALAARGINRVLVEGGAVLARSMLEAELVDAMALFLSPKLIGPEGIDAFAGLPLGEVMAPFREMGQEVLGADRLTLYERRERT
jgi:diaminohydroxyphosphoribosylaminopyrimidine deaminase / 5-amino-6-(5-phosphoribosylamino)uracil reductase